MASKFQNRLAGTIVLVALGVIVLPSLLDGQKKKYQDDFAAIPLVPKSSDPVYKRALEPIEPLPSSPKNSLEKIQHQPSAATELPKNVQNNGDSALPSTADVQQAQVQQQQQALQNQQRAIQQQKLEQQRKQREIQKEAARALTLKKQQQDEAKRKFEQQRALAILNGDSPPVPKSFREPAQANSGNFVLQLGALRNADRVNELVKLLRSKGFAAYSIPAIPVTNQLTRILLGPSDSKEELQRQQTKIYQTLKLNGVIITNPANNH